MFHVINLPNLGRIFRKTKTNPHNSTVHLESPLFYPPSSPRRSVHVSCVLCILRPCLRPSSPSLPPKRACFSRFAHTSDVFASFFSLPPAEVCVFPAFCAHFGHVCVLLLPPSRRSVRVSCVLCTLRTYLRPSSPSLPPKCACFLRFVHTSAVNRQAMLFNALRGSVESALL